MSLLAHKAGHWRKMLAGVSVLTLTTALAIAPATAQEWTGSASNDWYDAANWLEGTLPGATANVFIDTRTSNTALLSGGAITVDQVFVGFENQADLTIDNGAQLSLNYLEAGYLSGANGIVKVSGTGSVLTLPRTPVGDPGPLNLVLGRGGRGELIVEQGGRADSDVSHLGESFGGRGVATVTGAASIWTSSDLVVGFILGEGELTVADGGVVESEVFTIGYGANGVATVTGTGSRLDVDGDIVVGFAGEGELTIADGGRAGTGTNIYIGREDGSLGVVTVTGPNASLHADGWLYAGSLSKASLATLIVEDGGQVETGQGVSVFSDDTITVRGTGSRITSTERLSLFLSAPGANPSNGGALNIQNGGSVHVGDIARVGYMGLNLWELNNTSLAQILQAYGVSAIADLTQAHVGVATATVSGPGSSLIVDEDLYIGYHAAGRLDISDGGRVESLNGMVGFLSGRAGRSQTYLNILDGLGTIEGPRPFGFGAVSVSGTGSEWNNSGYLAIAPWGPGEGSLIVSGGGKVTNAHGLIGSLDDVNGRASVIVSGEGSLWDSAALVAVGAKGNGSLRVENGGRVEIGDASLTSTLTGEYAAFNSFGEDHLLIGVLQGGRGEVTVTGAGSRLDVAEGITVSHSGHGSLTIADGGLTESRFVLAGFSETGTVTVNGAGSTLRAQDYITVGIWSKGDLTVSEGGKVESQSISIGHNTGASGTFTVTGENSIVNVSDTLNIGYWGKGSLTIAEGGKVGSQGEVRVSIDSGSKGLVVIGGGGSFDENDFHTVDPAAAAAPGQLETSALVFGSGDGRLVFNHTDTAYAFAPALQGTGIVQQWMGTTILTSDSSAFTGETFIRGGVLRIDNTLGGRVSVFGEGRLGGTGHILGDLFVGHPEAGGGGTVAPGASIGTLSVGGDAWFYSGSVLEIETLADGSTDVLAIAGTAHIDGGEVRIIALDPETAYAQGSSFRFLTAGSVLGTFDGLTSDSAFIDFAPVYTADGVYIELASIQSFPAVAVTFNQSQAAAGLQALQQSGDALLLYNELLMLDEAPARAAFDAASGEVYAALQGAGLRQGLAHGRRLIRQSHASGPEGFSLFGGVTAHDGRVEADRNGGRYDYDGTGFEAGVDWRGSEDRFALGAAWARTDGDLSLSARRSSASTEGWQAGAWARLGAQDAGFSVSAAVAYADTEAKASRRIDLGTQARAASATVDVTAVTAVAELRYAVPVSAGWSVGPVVSVEQGKAELDGFSERGAEALNLSSEGGEDSWAGLGVGGFGRWRGERGFFDAGLRYRAGGRTLSEVPLRLAGAPDAPFAVRAAQGEQDAWLVDVSGVYQLGRGWELQGDLSGLEGEDESQFSASVSLKWRF